jgi:beta-lactamase superfamily II metal-dependent hydrolase
MEVNIFDVGHGGCAVAEAPTGARMMLDCGFNADVPWFPSVEYLNQRIDTLLITNLDEDHVADLPYLLKNARVQSLVTNPTISAKALDAMKPDGMREGVSEAYELIARHGVGLIGSWQRQLGGIRWQAFYNRFGLDFEETNKLSLAVFVSFGNFTMLFGGDMEEPAWNKLMMLPAFRSRLSEVNVYVASHHGRQNGQSDRLLALMYPDIVVVSDGPKVHATQETVGWYSRRTHGIPDLDNIAFGNPSAKRSVLTTRRDGTIRINVASNGRYLITREGRHVPLPSPFAQAVLQQTPTGFLPRKP